ncbi:MAG: hypothetical protein ACRELV_02515, partial [Longimicrobiales bacterium]
AKATPATRRGVRRGRGAPSGPPPILEGQVVKPKREAAQAAVGVGLTEPGGPPAPVDPEVAALGLPTERQAVLNYLQHRYKGVGEKTAETVVDAFGAGQVFAVLRDDPERIRAVLGPSRSESLLEAWSADYGRRMEESGGAAAGRPSTVGCDSGFDGRRPE